jgi:hypothetical protein
MVYNQGDSRMEIIIVHHEKEVTQPHITYCGFTAKDAAQSFQEKFDIVPETVYQKVSINGRLVSYVPAPASVLNNFYSGAFYGFNSSG